MNFNFYHLMIAIAIYALGYFIGYKIGRVDGQYDAIKKMEDEQ